MTDSLVIKWAWVHGSLSAWTFDDLDSAVRSAVWASDEGTEAIDSIEVIEPDGTRIVHDKAAVAALMKPVEDKEYERYKAQPIPTVILDLRGPDGTWASYSSYVDPAKAEAEAADFRARLGADRVALRPYGQVRRG